MPSKGAIDYRKAFDTVSREALLYKLYNLGVRDRYFECLNVQELKAKIKHIRKLSESLDVLIGTEQGHPMSPELFKCYLFDLYKNLNNTLYVDAPMLDTERVTNIFWADNLVLLALDRESLQRLIDTVHQYCTTWGPTVNLEKTAVLVFNKSGKKLRQSQGLNYGSYKIPSAKE